MFVEWILCLSDILTLFDYVHQEISKENVLVLVLVQDTDDFLRWCLACQGREKFRTSEVRADGVGCDGVDGKR